LTFRVAPAGEVGDFIALVRKIEAAYPTWNGERILNSLRRLAGYDDPKFRAMYGGLKQGDALAPIGSLTQTDLDTLKAMTRHEVTPGVESGIVVDTFGEAVAMGHVLTGLSAGQHRNKRIDLTPSWSLGAGELMDNLYAVTIAGDLGQTATYVHFKQATAYIGPGSDATDAELVGDIDGFLLGDNLALYTSGGSLNKQLRLSELLHLYYCVFPRSAASQNTAGDRFKQFALRTVKSTLLGETRRFTVNYVYASQGKRKGLTSTAHLEDAKKSVDAFWEWLLKKKVAEGAP